MVNDRYLVLNRHGTSIIDTFFTEAVTLILEFRCGPGHIFSLQNTVLGLRLEKSFEIIENI